MYMSVVHGNRHFTRGTRLVTSLVALVVQTDTYVQIRNTSVILQHVFRNEAIHHRHCDLKKQKNGEAAFGKN